MNQVQSRKARLASAARVALPALLAAMLHKAPNQPPATDKRPLFLLPSN